MKPALSIAAAHLAMAAGVAVVVIAADSRRSPAYVCAGIIVLALGHLAALAAARRRQRARPASRSRHLTAINARSGINSDPAAGRPAAAPVAGIGRAPRSGIQP